MHLDKGRGWGTCCAWGFAVHRHDGGTEASLIPCSALMGPGQRAGAFARFPRLLAPDLAVISAAAAPWLHIPAGPAKPQCGGIEGTARGWVSIGVCPWGAAGAEGSSGLRGAGGDVSLTNLRVLTWESRVPGTDLGWFQLTSAWAELRGGGTGGTGWSWRFAGHGETFPFLSTSHSPRPCQRESRAPGKQG